MLSLRKNYKGILSAGIALLLVIAITIVYASWSTSSSLGTYTFKSGSLQVNVGPTSYQLNTPTSDGTGIYGKPFEYSDVAFRAKHIVPGDVVYVKTDFTVTADSSERTYKLADSAGNSISALSGATSSTAVLLKTLSSSADQYYASNATTEAAVIAATAVLGQITNATGGCATAGYNLDQVLHCIQNVTSIAADAAGDYAAAATARITSTSPATENGKQDFVNGSKVYGSGAAAAISASTGYSGNFTSQVGATITTLNIAFSVAASTGADEAPDATEATKYAKAINEAAIATQHALRHLNDVALAAAAPASVAPSSAGVIASVSAEASSGAIASFLSAADAALLGEVAISNVKIDENSLAAGFTPASGNTQHVLTYTIKFLNLPDECKESSIVGYNVEALTGGASAAGSVWANGIGGSPSYCSGLSSGNNNTNLSKYGQINLAFFGNSIQLKEVTT